MASPPTTTAAGDILLFLLIEFASGLAPSLRLFLILRLAFGVDMGGEWGVGAALAMESIPPGTRGVVSGILQTGYPSGYLLTAITYLFWPAPTQNNALVSSKCSAPTARRFLYAALLINFLSHGTQDLYPAFLQLQRHFKWVGNVKELFGTVYHIDLHCQYMAHA